MNSRLWLLTAIAGVALNAQAELTFDAVAGVAGDSLSGVMLIDETRGVVAGENLLHSFTTFNVNAGELALFTGPATISNIIARVTGSTPTNIDGTLTSSISDADFFLLNPNGIAVGPDAVISVDGALRLSTASTLTFEDGSQLTVSGSGAAALTTAAPSSFGFGMTAADIRFDGTRLVSTSGNAPIEGINLSAGNITLENTQIELTGQDISLAAVAPGASVPVDGAMTAAPTAAGGFGAITIVNDTAQDVADLETTGDPAGSIMISGDSLSLTRSQVFADTTGLESGGGITVLLSGALNVADDSRITTDVLGTGVGSDVSITAGDVLVDGDFSAISSENRSFAGTGGAVTITSDTLTVSGGAELSTATLGAGDGGSLNITTGTLTLATGGALNSRTVQAGSGGDITVTASEAITASGAGSAITSSTLSFFGGSAGDVTLTTGALSLDDGAQVLAESVIGLSGAAGAITIGADSVSVAGGAEISSSNASDTAASGAVTITAAMVTVVSDADTTSSIASATNGGAGGGSVTIAGSVEVGTGGAIETLTQDLASGDAGSIQVDGDLLVTGGGRIDARTLGNGGGGTITLNGSAVTVDGESSIISSSAAGGGDAGEITIAASSLTVRNAGQVDTRTTGSGDAGSIDVDATSVVVSGMSSGILSTSDSTGAAGNIDVSATDLQVSSAGSISTNTGTAGGASGTITLAATDIMISGDGSLVSSTTSGAAAGGSISLTATDVQMDDRGSISVSATGAGDAGSIELVASNRFDLQGSASIQTSALASGGGNVNIQVIEVIYLQDSTITASSGGADSADAGGVIEIDPVFLILDNSSIVAQAVQGDGGFINLIADNYIRSEGSLVSATSDFGNDGEVIIASPDNSVTGAVGALTVNFAEDGSLLVEPCAARRLDDRSSLVFETREAVISFPGEYESEPAVGCRR